MRIRVTSDDIDAGQRRNCTACAVALALRRATGLRWAVGMNERGVATARLDPLAWPARWHDLPPAVTEFVHRFDAGGRCEPFEFEFAACSEQRDQSPALSA